jgi:rhodanese-related sulfurtransferase
MEARWMKYITASELKNAGGRVVDVRMEAEFAAERLPGSECVPLNRLTAVASGWNREEPLILMCAAGVRSKDAMNRLAGMGFTNLTMVEGGLRACRHAGLDVVVERKTIPIVRQVLMVAGILVLLGLLLAYSSSVYFLVLPLLVGCGMVFSGMTGICPMAWLLSRMPWNRTPGCEAQGCRIG